VELTWEFIITIVVSLLVGGSGVGLVGYYLQKKQLDADTESKKEALREEREKMLIEARETAQDHVVKAWSALADEQAERIKALHDDNDRLQENVNGLRERVDLLVGELEQTRTEVAVLSREVRHRDDRIRELERIEVRQAEQISDLRREISALNNENIRLKNQRDELERRVGELEGMMARSSKESCSE
jgi:chromosome segregation ATPase